MSLSAKGSPTMKSRPMKYASAPFRSVGPVSNEMFRAGVSQYNADRGGVGSGATADFSVAFTWTGVVSVVDRLWFVRFGHFRLVMFSVAGVAVPMTAQTPPTSSG